MPLNNNERFLQTPTYDWKRLMRDLIELQAEIDKRLKAIEDRLDAGGL